MEARMRLSVGSCLIFLFVISPLEGRWRQIKAISGGAVNIIVQDTGGVIYTSTNSGLLKSADFGQTWTPTFTGLTLSSSVVLATDPVKAGVVYVGTNHTIYQSKDGGFTWSGLSLNTPAPIQYIAVARTNPQFIFVATFGDYIYRSTDGGSSWTRQTQGLTSAPNAGFMTSLTVDPTNANRVYTSTWRGRLFRSDDAAATWSQIADSGLWANGQIIISPSNPNVLYTTHDEFDFGRGTLLKSIDSGNTWSDAGRPSGRPSDAGQIAVHPTNPNTLYVTTGLGIAKTTAGGGTWTLVLTPGSTPLRAMSAISFNMVTPSQIFAGSYYFGFYRSTDSGASWFPFNNGIAGATVTGIEFCRDSPSVIYAGAQTVGYIKSVDGGATWAPIGTAQGLQNHSIGGIGVHPQNPNLVLVGTSAGSDISTANILKSIDGGLTFNAVANRYAPGFFRFNPLTPNIVNTSIADYQGGFLRSTDSGTNWIVPDSQYIYPGDYEFHPTLSNVLFSVGNQYTGAPLDTVYVLWSNTSGAAPWNRTAALGQGNFNTLALDKSNPTVLYVAGGVASENTEGIYKFNVTYNAGNVVSLSRVGGTFNNGLGNTSVHRLYYDALNKYLYASTPTGIFRSSDQATTWSSISDGLPNPSTDLIRSSPDGKRILVGTGSGIWEYTDTPPSTPIANIYPTTLDFGLQGAGTSLSATVSNTGDGPLQFSSITSTSSDFVVTNQCSLSGLNPGANCTISVKFNPTTPGQKNAILKIVDNALDSPQSVSLTGTAQPSGTPVVSLTPTTLVFPNQPLGTTSDTKTVSLTNVGTAPLAMSAVTASPSFHLVSNTCGAVLSVGGGCTMGVTFTPTATGASNGILSINDNASPGLQTVSLTGPSMLDTDGDGLPDDWERFGVTIGGVFVDLPAMGANWLHKDLFAQIDWMKALDHSHQPKPEVAAKLIDAFAALPVSNPDGKTGITLHLDCGPDCIMNPLSSPPTLWGTRSQSNTLFHIDPISGSANELGSRDILGRYQWDSFDAIKQVHFSPARASIFHYVIFAHCLVRFSANAPNTSSGLTRSAPGNDSIISLGSFTDSQLASCDSNGIGTALEQTGTLMHELGHSLGLLHGGPVKYLDSISNKPNQLSVMNYLFQNRGLFHNGLDGYFSYSTMALPPLDETNLNELIGLGLISGWGTRYYCSDGSIKDLPNATGPIDWNCDKQFETSIPALLRGIPPPTTLYSYQEVDKNVDILIFTGASIGQPGAPPPPKTTQAQELTKEQDAKIPTIHGVAILPPGDITLRFGASADLTYTVSNKGSVSDTFAIHATSSQSWVDVNLVPAQVTLAAGASQVITIPAHAPSFASPDQSTAVVTVQAVDLANPQVVDSGRTQVSAGTADLAVSITSPASILIGGNVNYAVVVSNNGPDPARDVALTYVLPPNASVTAVSGSTCIGTVTLMCPLGVLSSGSHVNVSITAIPTSAGAFSSTMGVSSSVYDPITANNTATQTTSVIGKPSITARIVGQSKTGNTITLTVSLTNGGTGIATSFQLNQVIVKVLNGTGNVVYGGPALPQGLGDLSQGASKSIELKFQVPSNVSELSISERGTMQDSAGNIYSFASAQSVVP